MGITHHSPLSGHQHSPRMQPSKRHHCTNQCTYSISVRRRHHLGHLVEALEAFNLACCVGDGNRDSWEGEDRRAGREDDICCCNWIGVVVEEVHAGIAPSRPTYRSLWSASRQVQGGRACERPSYSLRSDFSNWFNNPVNARHSVRRWIRSLFPARNHVTGRHGRTRASFRSPSNRAPAYGAPPRALPRGLHRFNDGCGRWNAYEARRQAVAARESPSRGAHAALPAAPAPPVASKC